MDKTERLKLLKTTLMKATAIHSILVSDDFQRHLLPHLQTLATVQHINPKAYDLDDQYIYALKNANATAGVYSELLKFLHDQAGMMEHIEKEIEQLTKKPS